MVYGLTKPKISDGNSPYNEAFSFTQEQYARLKIVRPDLFDTQRSPQERARLWKTFAQTSEGKAFRVR